MPTSLLDKGWLEALVASELERYDPEAARARLPAEVLQAGASATDLAPAAKLLVTRSLRRHRLETAPADPAATFLDEVRLHVGLVLDLSLVRGEPFEVARRRPEIAAFLCAAVGENELATAAYPPAAPRAITRVLRAAEASLRSQLHPPGDPVQGLPLHPGQLAVQRRRLARIAMGHHRVQRLDPTALARHGQYAFRETVLLVETLAGLFRQTGPDDAQALPVRRRQLVRLALPRPWLKEARRGLAAPRPAADLAEAAPPAVRPFLLEQLFLAVLRARLPGEAPARFVEEFVSAAALDPATVAAAQVEAAAQHGDHQVWFEAIDEGGPSSWQALAAEWDHAADQVVERVSSAVTGNLEAIVMEIRETGELGALLAKATAGTKLTTDEKRKVRAQLVDLAKTVPALAIFAAPGGMLLLPLLAKLLPFNLMPSAWERTAAKAKAARAAAEKPPEKAAG